MIYYTLWIVVVTMLLISCTDSRAVREDHLSEIDKDLASILSEAADAPADTHADSPLDKSVLSGFIPVDESSKDLKSPKTDEDLQSDLARRFGSSVPEDNNDDRDTTLDEFLNDLKLDRNEGSDVPAKELLDDLDSDNDEPIPIDILDDLESGKRQRPRDSVSLKDLKDQSDKKEKMAEKLFDILNKVETQSQDNDDEPMPKELLDDLEAAQSENSDKESIPKELLDDLKQDARKKDATRNTDCGLRCKNDALINILMDELVSRMTTIAKRGDKIPKRMMDLWKKYRTKRGNIKSDTKTHSLMM